MVGEISAWKYPSASVAFSQQPRQKIGGAVFFWSPPGQGLPAGNAPGWKYTFRFSWGQEWLRSHLPRQSWGREVGMAIRRTSVRRSIRTVRQGVKVTIRKTVKVRRIR